MKSKNIDANKIASWYLNNNKKIEEEVGNFNYKRLMTIMAYSQIDYMKDRGRKLYKNRLARNGIVVSIANLMPNKSLGYDELDREVTEFLNQINENYGNLSSDDIDRVHLELLDMFEDPGELKLELVESW